ncbi:MAG: hypothetical protein ACRCYY_17035, partial [Trueperaceae bacterium]
MNEESYNSFHEWVSSAEQYKPTTHEHRLSSSFQLEMTQIFQPRGFYPDPPLPGYNIQLILKGGHGRADFGNDSFYTGEKSRGTLIIAPTHTACNYELFDGSLL